MTMELKKRDCGIEMRLVPYGAGWIDVHLDIEGKHLYFIISSVLGHRFSDLLRALYHLYPNQRDPEDADDLLEYQFGICEWDGDEYKVQEIINDVEGRELPFVSRDIPWKATFTWDEEGSQSIWLLEREPTEETDFILHIHIDLCRDEMEHFEFTVRYQDFCYAVAKACTVALKSHGFYGYHHSVYTEDMNIRYLLFLKSIALGNDEARQLVFGERGHGECSDFSKELELLLFDM